MLSTLQQLKQKMGLVDPAAVKLEKVAMLPLTKKPQSSAGGDLANLFDEAEKVGGQAAKSDAQGALQDAIEEINEIHFVSHEGGKARVFQEAFDHELNRKSLVSFACQDFKTLMAARTCVAVDGNGNTRRKPLADVWLNSPMRREYPKGMALLPGVAAPEGVYNLWTGWGVEPCAGNTAAPLEFIQEVICGGNKRLAAYLLGWAAWCVQNPARQAEVAVVLVGKKGTGKGTLGRWMLSIFGMHGLHILQRRHLVGNFNAHLRSLCFIFADESFFAGDHEGQAVLKGIVTEEQITIERKGVDAFGVRNRLKVLMATNESWVVPASEDERRYCVIEVSEAKRGDHDYFGALDQQMRNGGLAALLHYLLTLDLSDFNIRAAPNSEALEKQKILSLAPVKAWLYERLWEGRLGFIDSTWKHDQPREQIVASVSEYVSRRGIRYASIDARSIGVVLHEVFPLLDEARESTGGRRRLWIFPSLSDARCQFAKHVGFEFSSWPDDEE